MAIAVAGLALAGCGSERQDADEPEGEFTLEVVDASFPARQTTAQHSTMRIAVRNTDDRNLPNLAVTIDTEAPGGGDPAAAFATSGTDPRLADPERPVWIVDRGPERRRHRRHQHLGGRAPCSPARRARSSGA